MGQLAIGNNRTSVEGIEQTPEIKTIFQQAYGATLSSIVQVGPPVHEFSVPTVLPDDIDLRHTATPYPPVIDQGDVPSCTADAAVAAMELTSRRQKIFPLWSLSSVYLYYMLLQGSNSSQNNVQDAIPGTLDSRLAQTGVSVFDATKQLEKGVAPIEYWAHSKPWNMTPSVAAQDKARQFRASPGKCVLLKQSIEQLKTVLAGGFSILFSFAVTEQGDEWMRSDTRQRESNFLFPANWGLAEVSRIKYAHSVVLIGYNDTARHFLARNSWGPKWANEGHFFMDFDAVVEPFWCRDFFTVLEVVD